MHLNLEFPKKTILVSGTNIEVVTERYELLNGTLLIKARFYQAHFQIDQIAQKQVTPGSFHLVSIDPPIIQQS